MLLCQHIVAGSTVRPVPVCRSSQNGVTYMPVSAIALSFLTTRIRIAGHTLPFSLQALLLRFVLPLAIAGGAYWLVRYGLRKLLAFAETDDAIVQRAMHWTRRIYRLIFALFALYLGSKILGARSGEYILAALSFLNQPLFTSGDTNISLVTILSLIPIFYVATWLSKGVKRSIDSSLLQRLSIDPAQRFSIASLVHYATMALIIVIGLSVIGINFSSLTVIFGVLGIGVGFGLQSAVANFFAGLVIILTRPIKEGDRILVEEYEGTVHRIRLLSTVINTITKETIIIPNSQITQNSVYNYSFDASTIVICNPVQVSYSSDLDLVREVLLDLGPKSPFWDPDGEQWVLIKSFDDSGITVVLCTQISDARQRNHALSWINLEIWRAFKANGIEIPFPQMDLHVKEPPAPQQE